ncbi:hypothetical protein LCGC14_2973590 [marine sediment metagenome]|uniref:Uncharacterized protein n=1 Tax=marine sediment metagenome TaxID=412755 RepID=A0A0F8X8R1_9ZZZZ
MEIKKLLKTLLEEAEFYEEEASDHGTAIACRAAIAAVEALRQRVAELGKDYGNAVDKFDACRAALARRVKQDTGALPHPPDSNIQEWHEWLIEQSDIGAEAVEAHRDVRGAQAHVRARRDPFLAQVDDGHPALAGGGDREPSRSRGSRDQEYDDRADQPHRDRGETCSCQALHVVPCASVP